MSRSRNLSSAATAPNFPGTGAGGVAPNRPRSASRSYQRAGGEHFAARCVGHHHPHPGRTRALLTDVRQGIELIGTKWHDTERLAPGSAGPAGRVAEAILALIAADTSMIAFAAPIRTECVTNGSVPRRGSLDKLSRRPAPRSVAALTMRYRRHYAVIVWLRRPAALAAPRSLRQPPALPVRRQGQRSMLLAGGT